MEVVLAVVGTIAPCYNKGNFVITPEVRVSPYIGVRVYVTPNLGNTFRKQFYIKMHGVNNSVKFNAMSNLGK